MDKKYIDTVRLLLDVAPFVFKGSYFAMKGGTAINLFVRDMPRLSVDVDVVYTDLSHNDRDSALKAIESALDKVADTLRHSLGAEVRSSVSGSEHESKLFVTKNKILVKVEVNHVFRGSVYPVKQGRLSAAAQQKFSRSIILPILDPDELYASKLVAALDRQHPRDLFDVMNLYSYGGITPRARRAFVVYIAGHNRPIHELLPPQTQDISRSFEQEFKGMTGSPVSLAQLEETRERLFKEFPSTFDDKERAFLLSIKRLKPDWDILGIPGIENLPAIKWKLLNLDKLSKSNPGKYRTMLYQLESRLGQ